MVRTTALPATQWFTRLAQLFVIASLVLLTLGLAQSARAASRILYAAPGATGSGASWSDPADLQAVIRAASYGDEIWVKAGTYKPTKDNNRAATFYLPSGVKIYGGFAGTETDLSQRNIARNMTTLSGDLGMAGWMNDNSYHVVSSGSCAEECGTLDGFTIISGYARSGGENSRGAGIYLYTSSPTLRNLVIQANDAEIGGGIFSGFLSRPKLTNVTIKGNRADYGGGMYNERGSYPTLINSLLIQNVAEFGGGALTNALESRATLINVTVAGNMAGNYGPALVNDRATLTLRNTIVWGSADDDSSQISGAVDAQYSLIQGTAVYTGEGNINFNPYFVSATDFHATSSWVIDGGNNSFLPPDVTTDRDDAPRFVQKGSDPARTVDMGAYEVQPAIYVDQRASGNNSGTSWKNAYTDLQTALQDGQPDLPIWVAAGTYTPTNDGDRAKTFLMGYGMRVYGGFAGNETDLSQRNLAANQTILSGDIGAPGDTSDNSYHVVTLINPIPNLARDCFGPCAYLDGVTITGGRADGFEENGKGGGIYSHDGPTLQLTNATISNNYARYGGGIYDDTSAAILTNVTISGNGADLGGGMYNVGASQPTLTNVVISGNEAFLGGGIYNANSGSIKLTNATISGNYGSDGGGINNAGASADQLTVRNSIVWGNITRPDTQTPAQIAGPANVQYSLVQGGFTGAGNIDANPQFVAAVPTTRSADGNLRLQSGSPAIDAGLNSAFPQDITTDRDGNPRIVDMPGVLRYRARTQARSADDTARSLEMRAALLDQQSCPPAP